jgi:hypothetical protein
MSTEAFADVLQRARSELTPEEQRRLVEQLALVACANVSPTIGSDTEKSLYDALNERGMIGSMTDGPGDLSTNPKYMKGFGRDGD